MCYKLERLPAIGYSPDSTDPLIIKRSRCHNLFEPGMQINYESIIWKEWKNQQIPFLFDQEDAPIITEEDDRVIVNFDIIASAFYFLSGFQELDKTKLDVLGRFQYKNSIQQKLNIITLPVVNYYFDIFKTALETAYHLKLENKLWENYNFAGCLTHDIDNCESAWLQGSYREFRKGKLLTPFRLISKKIFSQDEWFNFGKIIDIEKNYNANSSFYFLPVKAKKNGITNADYDVKKKKFKDVFELIKNNGSQVGIHGSVGAHTDPECLKKDIETLKIDVWGGRFHFLLYDVFNTPEVLDKMNLKYDTSLGFAEQYGFRNGYCLPFYLYDLKNDRPTNVIEIPLILMDCTLSRYMELSREKAVEKISEIIGEIEKFRGCFTILWHNTYFSDCKYTGWREIFEKILQICTEKKALLTSAEGIVKYFQNTSNCSNNGY